MALSPADFYAYSRATGAPVPEDPEERAQMAPSVAEFRRNQLKAPEQGQQQGQNALATLAGIGAMALAGVGAYQFAKGRLPKGAPASATAPVQTVDILRQAETDLRRVTTEGTQPAPSTPPPLSRQEVYKQVAAKPVEDLPRVYRPKGGADVPTYTDPRTGEIFSSGRNPSATTKTAGFTPRQYVESTGSLEVDPTDRLVEEMSEFQAARKKQLQSRMGRAYGQQLEKTADDLLQQLQATAPDLTTIQESSVGAQQNQFINAIESGEDQVTGRMKNQLQRNEGVDLAQVEALENLEGSIQVAAAQLPDGLPKDQVKLVVNETLFLQPGSTLQKIIARSQAKASPTPVSVIGQYPPIPETPLKPYAKFPGELGSSSGESIVVTEVKPAVGLTNIRRGNVEFTAREGRLGALTKPVRYTVLPPGTPTEGRLFKGPSTPTLSADELNSKLAEIETSKNLQIESAIARGLTEARAKRNVQLSESQQQALEASLPAYSDEDVLSRTGVRSYGDIADAERFTEEISSKSGKIKALEEGGFLEEQIDPGDVRVEPRRVNLGVMVRPASKTSYRGITGRPDLGIYGEQAPGRGGQPNFGSGSVEARKEIKTEGEDRGITTPRAFLPGVDSPETRTPEGFVYTEEALLKPTAARGGHRKYGVQPPTRPEAARESLAVSQELTRLQREGKTEEAQAFLDKMMQERGISSVGSSQPLRQKMTRQGRFSN